VRSARGVLLAPLVAVLGFSAAPAQEEETPPPPVPPVEEPVVPLTDPKVLERLDGLERRLERLDRKIDELTMLLTTVYGERIRRAEALAADRELAAAIRAVESRYRITGALDAFVSDDPEALEALHGRLARASAGDPRAFASDHDVVVLLAAMASRPACLARLSSTFVTALSGRDADATRALGMALLARGEPGAQEAALWALLRAGHRSLGPRLAAHAGAVDPARPKLAALAAAAATASGDTPSLGRLNAFVRGAQLPPAFVYRLANELRSAGSRAAFRLYAELLAEERYAFAAAQAFARIDGFTRRVGWREVKDGRERLRAEFSSWLDANWSSLVYDRPRARFVLKGTPDR
jgi:hypothetical protein